MFAILITSQSGAGSKTDGTPTKTCSPFFKFTIATFAAEFCSLTAVRSVRVKVADIVLGSMQLVV
jgi:hypothetical protein